VVGLALRSLELHHALQAHDAWLGRYLGQWNACVVHSIAFPLRAPCSALVLFQGFRADRFDSEGLLLRSPHLAFTWWWSHGDVVAMCRACRCSGKKTQLLTLC
jgi:hypothetical protein